MPRLKRILLRMDIYRLQNPCNFSYYLTGSFVGMDVFEVYVVKIY